MNVGLRIPTNISVGPTMRRLDLRQYINFVWRRWKFIGAIAAVALIWAVIYLVRATPLYTATTQVLLQQPDRAPTLEIGSSDYYRFDSRSFIENQLAILRSESLLRRVVVKERLLAPAAQVDPDSAGAPKEDPKSSEDRRILDGVNRLRGALNVLRSGQAHVLSISITWVDPVRAAELANAVADAYVVDQLDARFEAAKRASSWLSDRLVDLRQQLRESEEAVAAFRSKHGLVRAGASVSLNEQQLSELNSKLIAARADAADKKTRVEFLEQVAAGRKTLESLPDSFQSTVQSGLMGSLRAKLADASQRGADLLARYNSRHPAIVNLEAEKRDIERSIGAETHRMAQGVRSEYALAKARLEATEQAMREATGQGGLDGDEAVRLRELERTAAVNKSLFEDFLQKAKVTEEQSTFRAREARVIVPAQAGGQSFPRNGTVLFTALFVGLGLGLSGAIAMEMLRAGFTTPGEVEDALGMPVLASVRKMEKSKLVKDRKNIPLPYYQVHYPLSPFSESIRTLRSGIHMSDVDRPPKVIHITSARPGEGKTTIAISLAISAAFSGQKVALVDADLRHPSASRSFGLESEKGLVDLLLGSATFDASSFETDIKCLTMIPAGGKTLNPPDLLASERMRVLVSRLKEKFDYVVIDTPPVGPVIDPTIVAGLADKTIFVAQWGATPRELVQTSVQQVSNQKRVGGIVLNCVIQERAKKYGGEYYYGKSYEKYYSQS